MLAVWTDDEKQSAVINPRVANYTGQAELAERIQEGVKALEAGDEELATRALQRANELAEQTGHEATQQAHPQARGRRRQGHAAYQEERR